MTESAPKRIELEADDRRRVQRLTEEVQGRLEEIGLIAARAHGIRLDEGAVRKFVPHRSQARDEPGIVVGGDPMRLLTASRGLRPPAAGAPLAPAPRTAPR